MSAAGPDTEAGEQTVSTDLVRGAHGLPALTQAGADLVPTRIQGPPAMGQDLVRTITETAAAVRYLDATGRPAADITIIATAAVVCTGDTQADALQAATDLAREAPHLRISTMTLARVPGPVEGEWQWAVTLCLASPDPRTGEYSAEVHHGEPVARPGY
jgi:hypothetical protein